MVVKSEVLNDFPRFFSVLIVKFTAGSAVNLTLKMKGDMVVKKLDLKPKIDAMMMDFLEVLQSFSVERIEQENEQCVLSLFATSRSSESTSFKKSLRCWFGSSDRSLWNEHPFCTNRMVSDRRGKSQTEDIDEFHRLVGDLTAIDTTILDEDHALLLLISLPSSYDNFMETLLYDRVTLKLENVLATLNSRELQKMTEAKGDGGEGLYVRGRSRQRDMEQGTDSAWSKSQRRSIRLRCYICQSEENLKRDCLRYNHKKSQGFVRNEDQVSGSGADEYDNVDVMMAMSVDELLDWIMDSGGSYHMTYIRDYLVDFEEYDGDNILLGDGRECRVRGTGKVQVQMRNGSSFVLDNVRYVPELRRNLISLGTIEKEVTRKTLKGRKQLGEYQTGWKIKTGNVLNFYNQRSTQQCTKSGVAKYLGVAVIQQQNGLVKETNVTLLAKGLFRLLVSIMQGMLDRVKVMLIPGIPYGFSAVDYEADFQVEGGLEKMIWSDVYLLSRLRSGLQSPGFTTESWYRLCGRDTSYCGWRVVYQETVMWKRMVSGHVYMRLEARVSGAYGNYKPTIKDKDGKDIVIPYENFDENHKKMISKNDEAKMVLYNALPKKEYERIFMCDTSQNIWDSLITTHQGRQEEDPEGASSVAIQTTSLVIVQRILSTIKRRSWWVVGVIAEMIKKKFVSWHTKTRTSSPPYQPLLPPSDYVSRPPSTTPTSKTSIPQLSPTSNNNNLLLTPKSTPPSLTSPPPAPTQPSKLTSPLDINLDLIELLFSTPPTSPQAFLDSFEDLPPTTTNPTPPRPSSKKPHGTRK
ncbi:hypothetical protein Tco_0379543 [Tanacetum coccineum]